MTAVAVKDDRTTTYAESVAGSSDSDSSDEDSDDSLVSEEETAEAEKEADAILARLKAAEEAEQAAHGELNNGGEDEETTEDAEEWGGIDA
jgi:hypothetical protein